MKFDQASPLRLAAPVAAALLLAACAQEAEEKTYATDVEDVGGGELIVTQEDPDAVPVDTPDTPMTPTAEAEEEAPAE